MEESSARGSGHGMRPEFDAAGLTDAIGQEHFYPSVNLAVGAVAPSTTSEQ